MTSFTLWKPHSMSVPTLCRLAATVLVFVSLTFAHHAAKPYARICTAVLDAGSKLRYRGRIDDQYRIGGARPSPTRHDLKETLDALLAGKDVALAETPTDGCVITTSELPAAKTPVTFTDHVAPILKKH